MNPAIRIESALATTRRLAKRCVGTVAPIVLLAMVGLGCAAPGAGSEQILASDPQAQAARIAELRRAIERDHATLENLISRPSTENAAELHDDPELREIAVRLTGQERALERLEALQRQSSATK